MLATDTVKFEFLSNTNEVIKIVSAQTTPKIADSIHSIDPNQFLEAYPQYSTYSFVKLRNRSVWHLAKITQLHASQNDNVVRSATLITGKGHTITRPLSDLYPLEVNASNASDVIVTTPVSEKLDTSSSQNIDEDFDIDTIEVQEESVTEESSDED